jgi:hypothetical protein
VKKSLAQNAPRRKSRKIAGLLIPQSRHCATATMMLWKVWTPTSGVVYYLPDNAPEWREVAAPAKPAGNAQL